MNRFRLLTLCALALAAGILAATTRREPKTTPAASAPPPLVATAPALPVPAETPAAPAAPEASKPATARVEPTTSPASAALSASAPAGMIVAIDPETGELVPATAEQIRELFPEGTEALQSTQGVVQIQRPDGTVGIRVGSQLQDYSFAHIGPDGKIHRGCASSHRMPTVDETPVVSPKYEER